MTRTIINSLFHQKLIWKFNRNYFTIRSDALPKAQNDTAKQLRLRIKAAGPITVADYMKEVLISPSGGYYMHKDVFGQGGDFITSPELGQVFGEMVAIWFLNEWSKAGSPKPVQIVELGPGRGTLVQDIIRVFSHFRLLEKASVHLVEVSPFLCEVQYRRLCVPPELCIDNQTNVKEKNSLAYRFCVNSKGVPISWYKDLSEVPNCFTLLIAHEFFDALPIHKFHKTSKGYREVLVDLDDNDLKFKFTIAPSETVTGKMFIKSTETRPHVEISPQSLTLVQQIAQRLESYGGLALIADYGHNGEGTDTFRAFKDHKLHDPLLEAGTADLTADVDFACLKEAALAKNGVLAFGPITQREFLLNMGIEHRISLLKQNATKEQLDSLDFSYKMMIEPEQMGNRFKFLALLPATLKPILQKYPITGFNSLL